MGEVRGGLFVVSCLVGAIACGGSTDSEGSGGGAGAGGTSGGAGGSGGAVGGSSGSGGATGGSGGSPASCSELSAQYLAELESAKTCSPVIDMPQCTEQVPDAVVCGCPTYVNPANQDALTKLLELQQEWDAQKCSEGIGCTAGCPSVQGGGCFSAAGDPTGACVDYGPD